MEINPELLSVTGALANEENFKILAAIALGANTPDKISRLTGFDTAKIIKSMVKLEKAGLIENQAHTGCRYCAQKLKDLNYNLNKNVAHKPTQPAPTASSVTGGCRLFPNPAKTGCRCWNIWPICSNLTNSTPKSRLTSNSPPCTMILPLCAVI